MKWTDRIRSIKLIFILAAIIIVVLSIVVSRLLIRDLFREETTRMQVLAEAMRSLSIADEHTDLNLVLKVINENNTNPKDFPGLILLDLHMPVMDGWEFLYRFSEDIYPHCKNTKVIITSYSIDEVDSERAKKYPFIVDFLTSSLSVEYLESLPRSLLSDELV